MDVNIVARFSTVIIYTMGFTERKWCAKKDGQNDHGDMAYDFQYGVFHRDMIPLEDDYFDFQDDTFSESSLS